ncbi:hypothetical protein QR680_013626 [Steinernema hermaphroditum]|uniref:Tudor domain-containing protein n=1 Tax=Steinernema hermaphroditum TaxID=289476 RepID=A0AA39I647_9BILA|nr:hypothetical protein QR680_013626 [Steinernema hermaphroditum]
MKPSKAEPGADMASNAAPKGRVTVPPKARKKPTVIQRMVIENTFRCQLLEVFSPSEIYVRLTTDITNSLQYHCPHKLQKLQRTPALGSFVMAPLEEHVYGRAEVRSVNDTENGVFVLVHFIDEGKYDWVHVGTLCEIEEQMFFHPMQAVQLALFGVECPSSKASRTDFLDESDGEDEEEKKEGEKKPRKKKKPTDCFWTVDHFERLKKVLSDYEDFQIQYIRTKKDKYGMKERALVQRMELFGIVDGKLEAIGPRFTAEAADLGVLYKRDLELRPNSMSAWQMAISVDWGEDVGGIIAPKGYLPGTKVFDESFQTTFGAISPSVTTFTKELIRESYADENGRVEMFVVPIKELSPFEFYVIPIKRTPDLPLTGMRCSTILEQVLTLRQQFTDMLNAFYIEKQNRVFPDPLQTLRAIYERKIVFAVYETPPTESSVVARYRRVLLVGFVLVTDDPEMENDPSSWLVKVVFLDYGGTDTVPLTSLLQIHSKHCVQEPFTIQLVCPVNDIWPTVAKSNYEQRLSAIFRAIVPTDCIVSANLTEVMERPTSGAFDPKFAHIRPNVLVAKNLKETDRDDFLDKITGREFERAEKDARRRQDNELPKQLKVKKVGFGRIKRLHFEWITVAPEAEIAERPMTALAKPVSDMESFFLPRNRRR